MRRIDNATGTPGIWFLIASLALHSFLLWQFRFVRPYEPRSLSPSAIVVLPWNFGGEAASSPDHTRERAGSPRDTTAARGKPQASEAAARTASAQNELPQSAGAASASTPGAVTAGGGGDNAVTSGVGSGGLSKSGGGTAPGTGGSGTGAGTGTAKGTGSASAGDGRSTAERYAIAVPPAIQRTTSPYESEVYTEVDFYTLFTADFRTAVNVPANQVCVDGSILRTYERQILSHSVTDISKCRYEDYSDQDVMRCPKEAHTTIVTYNNHLSSPLSYSVNMCLAYDKSSCYWNFPDDGPEREICKVQGKYEGIWAQGTIRYYPCAQSTSRIFSHSLQYEVRFVQDVEFPETRMRKRIVQREKRSVPQCP